MQANREVPWGVVFMYVWMYVVVGALWICGSNNGNAGLSVATVEVSEG